MIRLNWLAGAAGGLLLAVPLVAYSAPPPVKAPKYVVTEIPRPPRDISGCEAGFQSVVYARRMNDQTQAAGYSLCYIATGDPAAPYLPRGSWGFAWTPTSGSFDLPALTVNPTDSLPREINESGFVVGWEFSQAGSLLAPLWTLGGGVSEAIDSAGNCNPNFSDTRADGISDDGTIAGLGFRVDASGSCRRTWILKRPSGEEITGPVGGRPSAINNSELLVGTSAGGAVKWSPALGTVMLLAGAPNTSTFAWNVNNGGDVVGYTNTFDANFTCVQSGDAYLWRADGTTTILQGMNDLPVNTAYGVNDRQQIVGFRQSPVCDSSGRPLGVRAMLWQEGVAYDLNDLIPKKSGIELNYASSINNKGEILVRGVRLGEDPKPCPRFDFDPVTGEPIYNDTYMCRSEYSFLLRPKKDGK